MGLDGSHEGPGHSPDGAADRSLVLRRQRSLLHRRVRQNERRNQIRSRGYGAADLSIIKAGIICQLNARTSILAKQTPSDQSTTPTRQSQRTLISANIGVKVRPDLPGAGPANELTTNAWPSISRSLLQGQGRATDDEVLSMGILRDIASRQEQVQARVDRRGWAQAGGLLITI